MKKIEGIDHQHRSIDHSLRMHSIHGTTLVQELRAVSWYELALVASVFVAIAAFFSFDIAMDFRTSATSFHIFADTIMGLSALLGIIFIWARLGRSRLWYTNELKQMETQRMSELKQIATARQMDAAQITHWRAKAESLRIGVAMEIEKWMEAWDLTSAEKEVCQLLLKGLSSKEISSIRSTSERTARHQSLAIYQKAGVTSRAELSAFFLEDFLDRGGANLPKRSLEAPAQNRSEEFVQ